MNIWNAWGMLSASRRAVINKIHLEISQSVFGILLLINTAEPTSVSCLLSLVNFPRYILSPFFNLFAILGKMKNIYVLFSFLDTEDRRKKKICHIDPSFKKEKNPLLKR